MRTPIFHAALFAAALSVYPVRALAQQPGDPPPAPVPAQPQPQIDEARIRELIDREVARVLADRAAKDAAERAAKEAAEKEAPRPE